MRKEKASSFALDTVSRDPIDLGLARVAKRACHPVRATAMADHHHHGDGCGHEEEDDHLKAGEGFEDFLYSKVRLLVLHRLPSPGLTTTTTQIDLDHVQGYNDSPSHPARSCIKSWDRRLDESEFAESDVDEQVIVRVPFAGSVKLRSVFVKAGPGDQTPTEVRLVRPLVPAAVVTRPTDEGSVSRR